LTGDGVVVGHLDTGVDGAHPALRASIAAFAVIDDLGRPVRPAPDAYDSDQHGTHTAGTIAAQEVNGRAVGVAPGARLASALVIEGGDTVARVLGGMDWALGQQIRILNMSLGFRGWWDDFLPVTRRLRELGVLPVFAVGNEGPGTSRSPGNYGEALSVGAVDRRGQVPSWSSSRRFTRRHDAIVPDVVAPGVGVVSARPGSGWQQMDGTSMATPHVSGLAALLCEADPAASVDDIEQAVFASCTRRAGVDEDRAGRGTPNAVKALEALRGR
jgi:subtilisin family serine protease